MSKELEALERIKEFYPQWHLCNRKDFNIIEIALKRIPELEKEIEDTHEAYTMAIEKHIKDENDYIEWVQEGGYDKTKVQAFDIIKEKRVDVGALYELDLELYNKYVKEINGTPKLTKKEYDLLKEVLK